MLHCHSPSERYNEEVAATIMWFVMSIGSLCGSLVVVSSRCNVIPTVYRLQLSSRYNKAADCLYLLYESNNFLILLTVLLR